MEVKKMLYEVLNNIKLKNWARETLEFYPVFNYTEWGKEELWEKKMNWEEWEDDTFYEVKTERDTEM